MVNQLYLHWRHLMYLNTWFYIHKHWTTLNLAASFPKSWALLLYSNFFPHHVNILSFTQHTVMYWNVWGSFYFESSTQSTSYFTMSSLTEVFLSEVWWPVLVPVSFLCTQPSILSSLLLLTGTFKLTTWSSADPKIHHWRRVWLEQE